MEHAIAIPQQTKAPLLHKKQTVPTRAVRIDHADGTGAALRGHAQGFLSRVSKTHFDSVFLRLVQPEWHARLCELAPLEGSGVHGGRAAFDISLMEFQFFLGLFFASGADERLR